MVHIISKDSVRVDANDQHTVWFMINKDTVPIPLGAEAGLVHYQPLGASTEKPTAHVDPDSEFFYVISGRGTLTTMARRRTLPVETPSSFLPASHTRSGRRPTSP